MLQLSFATELEARLEEFIAYQPPERKGLQFALHDRGGIAVLLMGHKSHKDANASDKRQASTN